MPHYWCVSGKIVSRVLFLPFFGHDFRVNIKNVFSQFSGVFFLTFYARTISHFFALIFSQHFLLALLVCFWKNCFVRFSPHFKSRYSCNYKRHFFALFYDDFFPNIFCSHYWCVSGKIVTAFFSSHFLDTILVWILKKFFSQFLRRFFLNIFCSHYFALFCDDFFKIFFACNIGVFLEKLFRAFFSLHFLVTILVWI